MARLKEYSHIIERLNPATAKRVSNNMTELGIINATGGDCHGRIQYLINTSVGFEKRIYQVIAEHGMSGVDRMAGAILGEYRAQQHARTPPQQAPEY